MKTREELLSEVKEGLSTGVLTEADVRSLISIQPSEVTSETTKQASEKTDKLSAVDVMFYIAGIVLFATILSAIAQSWDGGSHVLHIMLSAGVGTALWLLAYYLIGSANQNDLRKGLANALLLTGSLSLTTGGYIITNEIVGGFGEVNFIPMAFTFLVLGGLHIGFDKLISRKLVLLMGVLLAVAAFPSFLFGFLQEAESPVDAWMAVLIASSALLVYASRVVGKLYDKRRSIGNAFDSFAAFLALFSMYIASFGDNDVLWLIVLLGAVVGIFYLSIISQNRHLLGSGSFFLVVAIVTIAFRYFSGFGITSSLVVATLGLLGAAVVATSINKRYFKG